MNQEAKLTDLADSLVAINESIQSIQAKADSERRDLSEDEAREMDDLFADYDRTEAELERRKKVAAQTS